MKTIIISICLSLILINVSAQSCFTNTDNYEWISNVTINNQTHYSEQSGGYADYRSDLTVDPFNLVRGTCHSMYVGIDYADIEYPQWIGVWIDLNADGDFDDVFERINVSSEPYTDSYNLYFPIGEFDEIGLTDMRVIISYTSITSYCDAFDFGEVHDYKVNILPEDLTCYSAGNSTVFEYIDSCQCTQYRH